MTCKHGFYSPLVGTVCRNPECPDYLHKVGEGQCEGCPLFERGSMMSTQHSRPRILDDGTIAYPKRGWEPPMVPAGYRRKSDDLRSPDAWVFLPVLPPCKHRRREIRFSACGNAKVIHFCSLDMRCISNQCDQCEDRVDAVQ